jgi:hypothetical protein
LKQVENWRQCCQKVIVKNPSSLKNVFNPTQLHYQVFYLGLFRGILEKASWSEKIASLTEPLRWYNLVMPTVLLFRNVGLVVKKLVLPVS